MLCSARCSRQAATHPSSCAPAFPDRPGASCATRCATPSTRCPRCAKPRPAPGTTSAAPGCAHYSGRSAERALAEFVDRTLEPLHANDAGRQSQLLHTLEAFCAHGSRKAETARALHLERQSLYKRLAKIEAILNVDLDDEDARLGLHLALRARRLLGGAGLGPQRQHHPGHDAA